MKIKKLLSLITAVIFLMSVLFTNVVSAAEAKTVKVEVKTVTTAGSTTDNKAPSVKIVKDKAIEIAKTYLENPSDYQVSGTSLNPKWNGTSGYQWIIDFYVNKSQGGSANIALDADTGKLLNFSVWDSGTYQQNFIAKYTRTEAQTIADAFIANKLKDKIENYELQKEDVVNYDYKMNGIKEQVTYNYTYFKKVNGIPVNNSSINIVVDATNGKVRNFYSNIYDIDEKTYPSADKAISSAKAIDAFKSTIDMSLQYIPVYSPQSQQPKVLLAYAPYTNSNLIDAMSGKPVNGDGTPSEVMSDAYKKLLNNPVPMNPKASLVSKPITENQAIEKANTYKKAVEAMYGIKLDGDRSTYSSYVGNGPNNWNFYWYMNSSNTNVSLSITINGDTGNISSMSLGKYNYSLKTVDKNGKPIPVKEKYNWKKAKEKALTGIKKFAPDQYGFFVDENIAEPKMDANSKISMRDYGFNFTRVVNGIRYRDNSIYININRETGEITNMYFNWSDINFPSVKDIISKDTAVSKMLSDLKATLSYMVIVKYDTKGMPALAKTPKLVYSISNSSIPTTYGLLNLDAVSGKFIDWSGNEIEPGSSGNGQNLEDHWAKRSVELLIAQGIIKNFDNDYDKALTRADIIKMFSLTRGMLYYDPASFGQTFKDVPKNDGLYTYVENAVKMKIITDTNGDFNGSEKIKKNEFVKLLVNLMGYSDLAAVNDMFVTTGLKDVDGDAVGATAICKALGVLPLKEGEQYSGSDEVTFAEAAVTLYKALSFIK